ncbi:universal stress protein [Mucilaginibacter sp. AK015]|uniref:universal stress protein n=1 Tax=Mucilaginibacter sp. AK015 TaxID=2723072 RepID=UPI00160F916E|nr:universal stress protein [Mucilaginibacter sp. AK015]MBB5394916.1 nucleotide-binding universal stress UspA family protein [Mucilaginibacter sp. AK015]
MKTYLVPIDFSEAALNAAHFAASLSHQSDVTTIILMNAYYISPYETMFPDTNMVMLRQEEIEEEARDRLEGLKKLRDKLSKQVKEGVKINIRLNRSHLLRAVVDVIAQDNADLVILGSIGNSTVREGSAGIGDHVIKISKASAVPVIVVPPDYRYHLINEAVLACDFKKVKENIPMDVLHKLLGKQMVKLLVVNINPSGKDADTEQLAQQTSVHGMLKSFRPKYFYVNSPDVITGILNFAAEQNAQMVIALPHTYSFLQSILHNSISQQLAKNSTIPVLLLK